MLNGNGRQIIILIGFRVALVDGIVVFPAHYRNQITPITLESRFKGWDLCLLMNSVFFIDMVLLPILMELKSTVITCLMEQLLQKHVVVRHMEHMIIGALFVMDLRLQQIQCFQLKFM